MKRRRIILLSVLLVAGIAAAWSWREEARARKFAPQINAAACRYRVDPNLVKAIAWHESRFNPEARGTHGEIGLMQIQEIAAQEWADAEHNRGFEHQHCLDPGTNAMAATFYISKLLKRYTRADNPVPYALADYNAGRGNVLKWNTGAAATNSALFIERIGFPGTKNYVTSVMRRQEIYRMLARVGL